MEKEILEGKIGEVGGYDVEFKEGALVAKVQLGVQSQVGDGMIQLTASALGEVKIPAAKVAAALKAKIPGGIDDAIIDLIVNSILT